MSVFLPAFLSAYLLLLSAVAFLRSKTSATLWPRIRVLFLLILLLPVGLFPLMYLAYEKPRGSFMRVPLRVPYEVLRKRIDRHISRLATRHGVDPLLVRAMVEVESSYDPRALSPKGAMGLMQLRALTAGSLGVENPYDVEENIDAGIRYLKLMLKHHGGRLRLALAAYNAGPEAVRKYGGIPPYPETRSYVQRVLSRYRELNKKEKGEGETATPSGQGRSPPQKAGRKGPA